MRLNPRKELIYETDVIVGIDLSAKETNITPICINFLRTNAVITHQLLTNEEIISLLEKVKHLIEKQLMIVIDAPLSWNGKPYRELDKKAVKLGAHLLPMSLPGMQQLFKRATFLVSMIEKALDTNLIFETHPSSIAIILGFKNTVELVKKHYGEELCKGMADAYTCCFAGELFLTGKSVLIGDKYPFILPLKQKNCIFLFDIDGVLINNSERVSMVKKNRSLNFYSKKLMNLDKPRLIGVREAFKKAINGKLIIISGRPRKVYHQTLGQLRKAGLNSELIEKIILREESNTDPIEWKKQVISRLIEKYNTICEVHDDEEEVLDYVKRRYPWVKTFLHCCKKIMEF